MKDQKYPQNLEAEQSLIGSLMISEDAYYDVCDKVTPEDCYREVHREIMGAIYDLRRSKTPVDIVTVQEYFRSRGRLEAVGNTEYLLTLIDSIPSAANAEYYAGIVKSKSTRRQLLALAGSLETMAHDESKELTEIISAGQKGIIDLSGSVTRGRWYTYAELLTETMRQLEAAQESGTSMTGIPTGLPGLDRIICGMLPADFILLAGRPSLGKTALAQQITHNAARLGKRVAVFSREMSKEQLSMRAMQSEAEISGYQLRQPPWGEQTWRNIMDAYNRLYDMPIIVNDVSGKHYTELQAEARRVHMSQAVDLFVLDYLQLVKGNHRDSRRVEIQEVAQAVKDTANELKVPWIVISPLSRDCEKERRKPNLGDISECGAIEYIIDTALFLYRDYTDKKHMEILVEKARNFAQGKVDVRFDGRTMTFFEVDEEREEETPKQYGGSGGYRLPYADGADYEEGGYQG